LGRDGPGATRGGRTLLRRIANYIRLAAKVPSSAAWWRRQAGGIASMIRVRRREFITLMGGAAAWPLTAHAPGERVRRVAVLSSLAADDAEAQARHAAFLQGLQEWGWSTGRNVQIDYRWGAGDADRFRKYAVELVALSPDVILSTGTPVTAALLQATRS